MAIYLSSGVYVKEVDLSNIAPGLPSSIGAIVGASKKGPIDKAYLQTDPTNFVKRYGQPDPKTSWMHYAAIAFLEEATQLIVLRVAGDGFIYGGLLFQFNTPAAVDTATLLPFPSTDPHSVDFETAGAVTDATQNLAYFFAEGPGSYADSVQVEVLVSNLLPPTVTVAPGTVVGTIGMSTVSYRVSAFNKDTESDASVAVSHVFAAGTTNSALLTWDPVPGATGYKVYGRAAGTELFMKTVGTITNSSGKITVTDTGGGTPAGAIPDPATLPVASSFIVNVYDLTESATLAAESFLCSFEDQLDGYGQQMELEARINPYSHYIRVRNNSSAFLPDIPVLVYQDDGVSKAALTGGDSGTAVTSSEIAAGWQTFTDPEQFQIQILINAGYADPIVQTMMDSVAHNRKDSTTVLDMPSASQEVQAAIDYRNIALNLNSNRSALYTPDLLVQDVYNSKSLYVPPSGHVAALYAFTDRVSDPWYSPAGLNRGKLNVLGLRQKYNQGARDALASHQVNYVRVFPGGGYALWEQHTLQSNTSALSWVSVRRMFDLLEQSISKALLVTVHEPNDDFLGLLIVTLCTVYLQNLQNRRAIRKYQVVSDESNNPPYLVGLGQRNVSCIVTPILPAEKIELKVIITQQGANFQEIIAAGALQQ